MSLSIRDIVETTGVFAVVAGLLLVAYQINQATSIASAQARADYSAGWRSVDGTRQSENFGEVLAKSIYHPNELTAGEILELDGYYTGILDQLMTAQINWEAGVRESDWRIALHSVARSYFGNEYSHAWWDIAKEGFATDNEHFGATVDAAIKGIDTDRQRKMIDALQKTSN